MQNVALDGHSLVNRTPVDCFKYYDNSFNQRTNVLIVTKDDPTPEPWSEHSPSSGAVLQYEYVPSRWKGGNSYWICGDSLHDPMCTETLKINEAAFDNWTVMGHKGGIASASNLDWNGIDSIIHQPF